MRNISANTLFHFTPKFDYLIKILESDFKVQFCYEQFFNVVAGNKDQGYEKGVLMVCFCDIPLTSIKGHSEFYGKYAIGLTKEWALANGISPILYTYPDSKINKTIRSLYASLGRKDMDSETEPDLSEDTNLMSSIIQYIKPYSGEFMRNGELIKNYNFYNEREWRYIYQKEKKKPLWLKSGSDNVKKLNQEIIDSESDQFKLKFKADDIKYIVVKNEKDIMILVEKIMDLKTHRFSLRDLQKLSTKIISIEQILEDF